MWSTDETGGEAAHDACGRSVSVRVALARVRVLLDVDAVAVHVRARGPDGTAVLSRVPGSDSSVLPAVIALPRGRHEAASPAGAQPRASDLAAHPGAALVQVPLGPRGEPAALLSAVRLDGRPFDAGEVERARALGGLLWAERRAWGLFAPSAGPHAEDGASATRDGDAAPSCDHGTHAGPDTAEAVAHALLELAHELRSPLSAVAGAAGALALEVPAEQRSLVDILLRNARRALRLIDDATPAGSPPGRRPDRSARVDVGVLARDAVEDAIHAGRLTRVRLRVLLPQPGTAMVRGDAVELTQALDNLIVNADSYTPAGGTVTVSVVPVDHDGTVRIEVRDTGPGIPPGERTRVFHRFERGGAAAAGGVPGSGLGLAVVRRVVTAHGGTATAGEAPGGATRMVLVLPAAPPEGGEAPAPDPDEP